MKRIAFFLFLFPIAFSSSNLIISSVDYSYLYSNSAAEIIFHLNNTGDEEAKLTSANISFPNYIVDFMPASIGEGEESYVSFLVYDDCELEGTAYSFFSNFTYEDGSGSHSLNSDAYSIEVASPINLSLIEPQNLDNALGIDVESSRRVTYKIANRGKGILHFSVNVSHPDSIHSVIYTSYDRYVDREINNNSFAESPAESIVFSHILFPIFSGEYGTYSIVVDDSSCSYNRRIMNVRYQVLSSMRNAGINTIFADNKIGYPFALIIIFIIVSYSFKIEG